ncbi:DUF4397 domain-containing protein [Parapedobacter indicus]|uniref:DUF4397 domain-containing protein n=1 Tax=Parapedobacter indicus TaxID=1477437 RepID=A0A1I3UCC0_9SPHI|nr:DUF4397 domain-containing protein [Parapedobacter indicus]PPK99261.1 hypothetical protein CLV26_114112 [Parapedobacter indicus]SFJ81168.1 hypothetical protein SAMN05444682_114112 [Parapedobacter indicus]
MKRNRKAFSALFLGAVLLAGCIKDEEPEPEVRSGFAVVNSFLEARAVQHRLDMGRGFQPLNQGLQYRGIDFYAVPSCVDCKLEIISSNELAQLVDTTFTLEENRYYTSFLFGTETAPLHFVTEDHVPEGTEDPAAIAGVRFFNLAETSQRVTLHIAEAEPIEAFRNRTKETPETGKHAEEFIPTAHTGTHVLTIQDEDGEQLARRTGVALDPGDYLTLFLAGDGGESAPYYIGIVRHRGIN